MTVIDANVVKRSLIHGGQRMMRTMAFGVALFAAITVYHKVTSFPTPTIIEASFEDSRVSINEVNVGNKNVCWGVDYSGYSNISRVRIVGIRDSRVIVDSVFPSSAADKDLCVPRGEWVNEPATFSAVVSFNDNRADITSNPIVFSGVK